MSAPVHFTAIGRARPQGSKVSFGGVHRRVVDSNAEVLKPWRAVMTSAAREAMGSRPALEHAVQVAAVFTIQRPTTAPLSWRSRPRWAFPHTRGSGDVDKLARALLDSLTDARVVRDDSQVVVLTASKVFEGDPRAMPVPGVSVVVSAVEPGTDIGAVAVQEALL